VRGSFWVSLIVLMPVVAHGADRPDWAFPVADNIQPPSKDDNQPKTVTGSTKSYTQKADRRFKKSAGLVCGVAEVSVDHSTGEIMVQKFWCVVDCGIAVQPDNVVAQFEDGIVYGLGLALIEEISIRDVPSNSTISMTTDPRRSHPVRQSSDWSGPDAGANRRPSRQQCRGAAHRRAAA
jgi:hypothetical protein